MVDKGGQAGQSEPEEEFARPLTSFVKKAERKVERLPSEEEVAVGELFTRLRQALLVPKQGTDLPSELKWTLPLLDAKASTDTD